MNNKVFYHTLHRELWTWLSENPRKSKNQWHRWEYNGGDVPEVACDCFACGCTEVCDECPVLWNSDTGECDDNSEYQQWLSEGNLELRSALATRIAGLAVRDGVICE